MTVQNSHEDKDQSISYDLTGTNLVPDPTK